MIKENQKLYQVKTYWETELKEQQKKAINQFTLFFIILLLIAYSVNTQLEKLILNINNTTIESYILLTAITLITLYIAKSILNSAFKHLDKKETADQKRTMILSYLALKMNNQALDNKETKKEFERNLTKI